MRPKSIVLVLLAALASAGAGPVFYEPANYTGEAIEHAIASAYKDIRGRVFLPGGTYRITKTIKLNGLGPILIEGASQAVSYEEWNHASSVRLEWWGPKDEPMIRLDTLGLQLKNVMLDGRRIASHGVLLANGPQGGTGVNRLEDVVLQRFTVACFQAGEKETDQNASDSYFDRVWFYRAPSGFRSVNDQSVNNYFTGCQMGWLERGLDIERGGAVTYTGGSFGGTDLVLRVRYAGHNTGAIHIGPTRLERGGYRKRYMTLVDVRASDSLDRFVGAGQIRFVSVRMADGGKPDVPDDVDRTLMRIGPGAQVTAEGCLFKAAGDNEQWPLANVQGADKVGGATLRSEDTMWWGKLDSIIVGKEHSFVELITPADYMGILGPTIRRGTP